jgi:hypothetical protein
MTYYAKMQEFHIGSQRPPAKQVAWIYAEKTKKDGSTFCVELAAGCNAPGVYGKNKGTVWQIDHIDIVKGFKKKRRCP